MTPWVRIFKRAQGFDKGGAGSRLRLLKAGVSKRPYGGRIRLLKDTQDLSPVAELHGNGTPDVQSKRSVKTEMHDAMRNNVIMGMLKRAKSPVQEAMMRMLKRSETESLNPMQEALRGHLVMRMLKKSGSESMSPKQEAMRSHVVMMMLKRAEAEGASGTEEEKDDDEGEEEGEERLLRVLEGKRMGMEDQNCTLI